MAELDIEKIVNTVEVTQSIEDPKEPEPSWGEKAFKQLSANLDEALSQHWDSTRRARAMMLVIGPIEEGVKAGDPLAVAANSYLYDKRVKDGRTIPSRFEELMADLHKNKRN